jgi:protein-S-isoprenylcysteine O-methyltransferase Ste14
MHLKGIDKFRSKIPLFSGKKIIILPLYWIFCMGLAFFILITFEKLPTLGNPCSILIPVLGMITIEFLALFLVYQMWLQRDRLRKKYGQRSYQRIFLVGFAGIITMISLAINNLIPIAVLNPPVWRQFPFSIFSLPINSVFGWNSMILDVIRWVLGSLIAIIGFLTILRSIMTFGFDYMTVVYLYFPEESEQQNHEIYSILRHPTYGALIYVCMAGFIIQFSILSLIYLIFYWIGFYIHIKFVEERELIVRFGESYFKYMKSVPAIFVHPRNILKFIQFLCGKV